MASTQPIDPKLATVDEAERDIVVVFVPADVTKPVAEVTVHQPAGDAIGCMLAHCKSHFAGNTLKTSQMDAYRAQVQSHSKGQDIPENLFQQLALTTTVDMIVLQPNKVETGFVSVNAYVDDKGMAKELPVNVRATSICNACGVPQNVLGDCFIGKQFDNNDGFQRINFTLADLSDDKWISAAKQHNERMRSAGTQNQLQQFMAAQGAAKASRPAPPPKLTEEEQARRREEKSKQLAIRDATRAKEAGNGLFAQQNFEGAATEYSKGLELLGVKSAADVEALDAATFGSNPVIHALLSNRSACRHKLGQDELALSDAVACAKVRPTWPKAFGRQAEALIALSRFDEAKHAVEQALALKPSTTKDLDEMMQLIREQT